MVEIQFVPGIVGTPAAITIPASAPDIQAVLAAQIVRTLTSSTVDEHVAADIQASVAIDDHAAADIQASSPIDDHAVHGHDITTVVPAGVGLAMLDAAAPGSLEAAVGGQTDPAAVDNSAAAQVHAYGAGVVTVHAFAAGVPTVHTRTGTDPVVAANPTRLSNRTFSLDASTVLGDILSLMYLEVGERVLVS